MPIDHSKEHKLIRGDIANVGKEIDRVLERLNQVPTRDEFSQLLEKTFAFATLKAEHERAKKVFANGLTSRFESLKAPAKTGAFPLLGSPSSARPAPPPRGV